MASGEARKLHAETGKPVLIVGAHGRPMWSEVFEHIPYILRRPIPRAYLRMVNGGGVRPYIAGKTPTKWTWRPYQPIPAEIRFTDKEMAFAKPYRGMVMIEPNVKDVGHTNKAWPVDRWADLVRYLDTPLVHCVPMSKQPYVATKVLKVITPTFRHAAAILSVSRLFIGTDGGLHHAAAAVGTPAVVLWSEFTSPEILGYPGMTNIRHAGEPCGSRVNCPGCREAMRRITVDEVLLAIKERLK